MRIGVVKEIKNSENRVALTPSGAQALHQAGHAVLVQGGAGLGSGFSDEAYLAAGATIVAVEQAWEADLVMKVKEPLESEYPYLKDQMLFTRSSSFFVLTDFKRREHEQNQGVFPRSISSFKIIA